MSDRIDLHIHTAYSSDGDHRPEEILQMARALNLRAVSISDHDAVEGSRLALQSGHDYGVEVIPSVELTTFFGGKEFHILGYFIDISNPGVLRQLGEIREFDEQRVRQMVGLLQDLGVAVTYDEVKVLSPQAVPKCSVIVKTAMTNGRNIGLPLFQDYVEGPRAKQPYHHFFLDHMRPGGDVYVEPLLRYSTKDAIEFV